MSLAAKLETDPDVAKAATVPGAKKRRRAVANTAASTEADVFALANRVDTISVLDRLSIAHNADSKRGEMATCPGCHREGALVCDGGIKCMFATCASCHPNPEFAGFRTNVDLVALAKSMEPADAAELICEWNGIEVPERTLSHGTNQLVAPPDPHPDAPDFPPDEPANDGRLTGGSSNEDRTVAKRSPFTLIEPAAIWAPLEEPKYLASGVIRRASLTEIVAYGASGKTWITVDLSVAVAAGVPWLGRFPTERGQVAYLDYENGSYEMRRRLQAVTTASGISTPVDGVALCCVPNIYMNDPAFGTQITTLAKDRALVVVDTLKAANPGVDENDSNMRTGLDAMRRAAELTGCAFVVLVHSKKITGSVTSIDPREAGRGSSAIFDAADTVLHVQYTEGKPLKVVQTKARLGRACDPFLVHIDDENGGVRVWAEDVPAAEGADAGAAFDAVCTEVLAVLRAHPGSSKRFLTEKAGKRFNTIVAALEHLQRHGAATTTGTGKSERWFAVTRTQGDDHAEH